MEIGKFYFLKDEYYSKFDSCGLMENKENGHGRPCLYCVEINEMMWMVPISSKVEKYKSILQYKIANRKPTDGIKMGFVNGEERAFLIQNICPVTDEYIKEQYIVGTREVTISEKTMKEIEKATNKILNLTLNENKNVTFTKIKDIMEGL